MDARTEILKLMASYRVEIEQNLGEFLMANCENLLEVGVPLPKLADALLTIAVAHLVKERGPEVAARELRMLALSCELHAPGGQAVRH